MTLSAESFWSEIKGYEERLKKNPASYCFAPLAEVYLRAGLLDDALAVTRAGVIRYPGFVAGQMALARVCHQKGLVDECRSALEVVTGAVPEHAEAQRMLARLYTESGRGQEACRALQTLLEFCPDDMTATHELESLQRRFTVDSIEDELELIEFTDADIFEEFEDEDLLVERVKPVVAVVEDPWAGVAATPASEPELSIEPEPMTVPVAPESAWPLPEQQFVSSVEPEESASPDLDSVWSMPEQQLVTAAREQEQDPLATPTLAELYVSQGFPEKAIEMYRRIVEADTSNQDARARLAELEQPSGAAEAGQAAVAAAELPLTQFNLPAQGAADQQTKVAVLEGWLENIRRLRTCR
jgi:tetratricopeptide (TPR) repeat protein